MATSGSSGRPQRGPEDSGPRGLLERRFGLLAHGTTVATEVRAGVLIFLTMSYILAVNPQILGTTGMPADDLVFATAVSAALATALMGLLTNYPFALAAGMGLNAYFAFGVVGRSGVGWQAALAAVFAAGILFVALTLSGARGALLRAVPASLKMATVSGIGLLLAMLGLQHAGIVRDDPATLVTLGPLTAPEPLLALAGLALMGAMMARRFRSALLVGILAVTAAAWAIGIAAPPTRLLAVPHLPRETLFAFDFGALLHGSMVPVVLAFLFVDLFDTAGTLTGIGKLAGVLDRDGDLPLADRAFLADALGTVGGAILGTSPVTSYVESATGIEEGGRTGLTALVVAALFLLALPFAPLIAAIPAVATAPALIVVGALMVGTLGELDWRRIDEALPASLTVAVMPFTFSIANGVAAGIVFWVALRWLAGRRREVPPLMTALAVLLVLYYALVRPAS